jgi:hypothetical protein
MNRGGAAGRYSTVFGRKDSASQLLESSQPALINHTQCDRPDRQARKASVILPTRGLKVSVSMDIAR